MMSKKPKHNERRSNALRRTQTLWKETKGRKGIKTQLEELKHDENMGLKHKKRGWKNNLKVVET